jgi:hypothetical protein
MTRSNPVMKKIFFLPLLLLALSVNSQTPDTARGPRKNPFHKDSLAVKIQRLKDSIDKTLQDVQQENNIRNLESVMNSVEKRRSKEKSKAILYIVLGVGMLIVLVIGLNRKRGTKRS